MSLKDLPVEMRPREKLLARGATALSDVELLALLLRTGLPGAGVFELATQVLREFDDRISPEVYHPNEGDLRWHFLRMG